MMTNDNKQSLPIIKSKKTHFVSIARFIPIIAITGAGIWLWDKVIQDRIIPKRWGVVEEGKIYRSGQFSTSFVKKH